MAKTAFLRPVRRHGLLTLAPSDQVALEVLEDIERAGGKGVEVKAVITVPRNAKRNRWFHSLLSKVAEATGGEAEAVKIWLKFRLGLTDSYRVGSRVVDVPRSVSFGAMDEGEFAAFCDRAVRLICEELLGGIEPGALKSEIEEMLGDGRNQRRRSE